MELARQIKNSQFRENKKKNEKEKGKRKKRWTQSLWRKVRGRWCHGSGSTAYGGRKTTNAGEETTGAWGVRATFKGFQGQGKSTLLSYNITYASKPDEKRILREK